MDVKMLANLQAAGTGYGKSGALNHADKAKHGAATAPLSNPQKGAYDVELSEAGIAASVEGKTHGDAVKGLTAEQIDVLEEGIQKSYELMIKTLTAHNTKLQGWLDKGDGKLNFSGVPLDTARFALPAVGTTPEEAAAAIAPGGAYSVESVADRLMGLAQAFAGEDPEKLKTMQAAIEEGFKQAGVEFKDATGEKNMPEITQKTHDEIWRRFDELYKKIEEKSAAPADAEKDAEE